MVMISKSFFTTGAFVAFYASVAFAIPTLTDLEARVPAQHNCRQMQWRSRECSLDRGPQHWDDVCENDHHDVRVPGIPCPPNTYCDNIIDVDQDNNLINNIQCLPSVKPGMKRPRSRRLDPQVGSSVKKQATTQLGPSVVAHNVDVLDDVLASVSAFFLSVDEGHVIKPVEPIVGKIRGKGTQVCAGDPASPQKAYECFPSGRQQLWVGDIIDFAWGLSSGQAGSLKYTVWPSGF